MTRIRLAWDALRQGIESAWFELTYRAPKKALTRKEAQTEMNRFVSELVERHGENSRFLNSGEGKIRGKETSK